MLIRVRRRSVVHVLSYSIAVFVLDLKFELDPVNLRLHFEFAICAHVDHRDVIIIMSQLP